MNIKLLTELIKKKKVQDDSRSFSAASEKIFEVYLLALARNFENLTLRNCGNLKVPEKCSGRMSAKITSFFM